MNVVNHNCPACGAILNFNPNIQNLNCKYCKVNYALDMLSGILPFDYSNVKKFEYPYLAGFYAEVFDENQNLIYENQIKETIRDISIKKLTSTVPNYKECEFNKIEKVNFFANDFKYEYILVPV